jgi:hypothetical protein
MASMGFCIFARFLTKESDENTFYIVTLFKNVLK